MPSPSPRGSIWKSAEGVPVKAVKKGAISAFFKKKQPPLVPYDDHDSSDKADEASAPVPALQPYFPFNRPENKKGEAGGKQLLNEKVPAVQQYNLVEQKDAAQEMDEAPAEELVQAGDNTHRTTTVSICARAHTQYTCTQHTHTHTHRTSRG